MNSIRTIAVALGLAAGIGFPMASMAAPASTVMPPETHHQLPPTGAVLHKILGMYSNQAQNLFVSVPAATFTALDAPTTVKCASKPGCTIYMGITAQVSTGTSGGQVALCTEVDGNFANNCGNYLGVLNTADSYRGYNDRENYHVAMGNHVVQTFVYLVNAGAYYSYQTDYTLTTP